MRYPVRGRCCHSSMGWEPGRQRLPTAVGSRNGETEVARDATVSREHVKYPHAAETRQAPAHQQKARRNRILVVEDNQLNACRGRRRTLGTRSRTGDFRFLVTVAAQDLRSGLTSPYGEAGRGGVGVVRAFLRHRFASPAEPCRRRWLHPGGTGALSGCQRSDAGTVAARKSGSHATLCWREQSRANSSLKRPKFPASRENTGNFIDSCPGGGANGSEKWRETRGLTVNSLRIGAGNFRGPCRELNRTIREIFALIRELMWPAPGARVTVGCPDKRGVPSGSAICGTEPQYAASAAARENASP